MFSNVFGVVKGFMGGLANKIMIGLILAMLVLLFVSYKAYQATSVRLEESDKSLRQSKVEFDTLDKSHKALLASQKVDEATQVKTEQDTAQAKEKASEIVQLVEDSVEKIRAKYTPLEKTEQNRIAEEREVGLERLKGVWASFCLGQPKHEYCVNSAKVGKK